MNDHFSPQNIKNSKAGILKEINGSDNLIICFGGIKHGIGIPVFEFFTSLKSYDCDKIFLRDFNQAFYHKGLNDDLPNFDVLLSYLQVFINERRYKRVMAIGNCMGGYAAILFGTILQVDRVVAFVPLTFIDRYKRLWYRDHREDKHFQNLYKSPLRRPAYYDLKKILKKEGKIPRIDAYFSPMERIDKVHSERLKGIKNIHLHHVGEDHMVVKSMRDAGRLDIIIKGFVDNQEKE